MEDKYILFNPFFELHIFPEGGFVFREISKNVKFLEGSEILLPKGTSIVNKKAAEFFYLSDGNKRLKEILKIIYPEYDYNFLIEKLKPFLEEAIKNQDIFLFPSPFPKNRKITGSFYHFYPIHTVLELTYSCNLKCLHCYASSSFEKNKKIPFEKLKEILSFLKEKGCKVIELTGGEPFLHPDFYEILKFSCENFDYVGISTNGTKIDEKYIQAFKEYKDKIIFNVSLDGPKNIHDEKRGVEGSFDKTINSIEKLSKNDFFVRVSMSVYPDTFEYIEDTLKIAIEKGAKKFVWSSVLPFGRGKNIKWEKVKNVFEIETEIVSKYKEFIQLINKEEYEKMMNYQNCGGGWKSIVMDPEGNLKPCVFISNKECNIGNLLKEDPYEIFKKEKIFKLYKLSLPKKEICNGCENFSYCAFCFSRAISKYKEKKDCLWAKSQNIEEIFDLEC
jgi:radical SAM protein with 4Fe4S-binding SPASM domain